MKEVTKLKADLHEPVCHCLGGRLDISAMCNVTEMRKDAARWNAVSYEIEELIRNGYCPVSLEDAYNEAIKE